VRATRLRAILDTAHDLLMDPAEVFSRQADKCCCCGKALTDVVSRTRGIGPAYSLMCKFLREAGIPGTNTRASRVFKLLDRAGFMSLRHKYYHDEMRGYSHGNFYVLDPGVTEPGPEEEGEKEVSIISLPGRFECLDDHGLLVLELRCLQCDWRFGNRLRQFLNQKTAA
jgi:hypothetical protein